MCIRDRIIGSKVNAYLNVNLYLKWALSPKFDLMIGATGSHFSNGFPIALWTPSAPLRLFLDLYRNWL